MIALGVYLLCCFTSAACGYLLLRAYRRSGTRLLLWSGLCFACFALNNLLLVVDLHVMPSVDLSVIRTLPAVVGVTLLLFGLIWESAR